MDAYNSDSVDGEFQMDDGSDDNAAARGVNDAEETSNATGWIKWFTTLEGHEYMVEVDEEYIKDPFNLFGLQEVLERTSLNNILKE